MKILNFSDLHLYSPVYNEYKNKVAWCQEVFYKEKPDAVVITGDIFESKEPKSPYKALGKVMFEDCPVICTLGNHEFFYRTPEKTYRYYERYYDPERYDVHYLDIIGHRDITKDGKTYRFVGNVLFYDGSTKTVPEQRMEKFANGCWADRFIHNFDWIELNKKCVQQIKENLSQDEEIINILCTHSVPHMYLNGHIFKPNGYHSEFNAYSGMDNLLLELSQWNISYALCGHTHMRQVGLELEGCNGVNCGNDYYPPYQYYVIEL